MKTVVCALVLTALLTGCDKAPIESSEPTPEFLAEGLKVYTQNCLTCHMADGGGVPHMQPALDGSPSVSGDPTTLIRMLIQGPNKVLPANRPHFSATMPSFSSKLSDEEIAAVLTYIRQEYGNHASMIKVQKVTTIHNQFGGG